MKSLRRVFSNRIILAFPLFPVLMWWLLSCSDESESTITPHESRDERTVVKETGETVSSGEYVETVLGVNIEMVWIPGGTFRMGNSVSIEECHRRWGGEENAYLNEKPVHQVTLDGFWMGRTEITQEQYMAVVGDNPSFFKAPPRSQKLPDWSEAKNTNEKLVEMGRAYPMPTKEEWESAFRLEGVSRPVEQVSWFDAVRFCEELSEAAGVVYGLPTEAQWEFCCRAGTETPFYTGNEISPKTVSFYHEGSGGPFLLYCSSKGVYLPTQRTEPVGSFPANPWGLYDMQGNVTEWCVDSYQFDYYECSPKRNPRNDRASRERGIRGGSWYTLGDGFDWRSACRMNLTNDVRANCVGLRVCRSASADSMP